MKNLTFIIFGFLFVFPAYSQKKKNAGTVTLARELEQLYNLALLPQYRTGIIKQESNFWLRQVKPLTCLDKTGMLVETKEFFTAPDQTVPFFSANEGGRIAGIELDFGSVLKGKYKDIILEAQWDDDVSPAIYSPTADFFGYT